MTLEGEAHLFIGQDTPKHPRTCRSQLLKSSAVTRSLRALAHFVSSTAFTKAAAAEGMSASRN